MEFKITKQETVAKIKAEVKAAIVEDIMNYLRDKYGDEMVAMVRTGGQTKVNEIAFIVGSVDNDGDVQDIVVTINPTVKEFASRKTANKTYVPFDFCAARDAYEEYVTEKEAKAAENAEKKAKKTAADQARREAAKAAKEAK